MRQVQVKVALLHMQRLLENPGQQYILHLPVILGLPTRPQVPDMLEQQGQHH